MTGLHRIDLTTSQKIEFSAKTVAVQAVHRTITLLSRRLNNCRPTVYDIQDRVQKVLQALFEKPEVNLTIRQLEIFNS